MNKLYVEPTSTTPPVSNDERLLSLLILAELKCFQIESNPNNALSAADTAPHRPRSGQQLRL